MKHTLKERLAEVLVEEFMTRLSENADLKVKFADMTGIAADDLIDALVEEVNEVVEQYRQRSLSNSRARNANGSSAGEMVLESPQKKTELADELTSETPGDRRTAAETLHLQDPAVPPQRPILHFHRHAEAPTAKAVVDEEEAKKLRNQFEELEQQVNKVLSTRVAEPPPVASLTQPVEEESSPEPEPEPEPTPDPVIVEFTDTSIVYLHAFMSLQPPEAPRAEAIQWDEDALDEKDKLFTFDWEELRFFLSTLNPLMWNVNKRGVLLLGKEESMRLVAAHNHIANDLRCSAPVLPFEFSTVVKGKGNLITKIEKNLSALKEAVAEEQSAHTLSLALSAMDGHVAELVGSSKTTARQGRDRMRASYSSAAIPSRYDVKQLEKILQKEKTLATSIHKELEAISEHAQIDFIAGLGSGSSEEWKPILNATYELRRGNRQEFFTVVSDLQQQHRAWQLMFEVTTDRGFFQLS